MNSKKEGFHSFQLTLYARYYEIVQSQIDFCSFFAIINQCVFHLAYIFIQYLHSMSFKTDTENNFDLFFATFSPISIIKGLTSYIFNIDIWSKWLLNEPIISPYNF